jgi:hypothetical protein
MTTKTKITLPSGNKPSIAVDPVKATVTTAEAYESGTPIETWADELVREQRVLAKGEVHKQLADLEARRVAIEDGVMRRANQALYQLLSDCLALAKLASQLDPNNVRSREIDAFLEDRNLKHGKDEPLFSKVITAVFGNVQRSRISSYRTVLKAASAAGVTASALPGWIESQGGIQEIRLAASGNGREQVSELASLALDYLLDQGSVFALQSDELSKQTSIESNGKEVVLVATKKHNGTFMVHAVIEDPAAVKKAVEVFQRKYQGAIKEFKYERKYRPSKSAA